MRTKRKVAGWKAAALAACIAVAGCAGTNPQAAIEMVEDAGYTDVQITGFDYWGCGTGLENAYVGNRIEMTGFTATAPTGRRVTGTVCKGTWGDYTIRFKR
jgi:hypothetical protein